MAGLTFPDVNLWMALILPDHVHHSTAKTWWNTDDSESICFIRITQISVLRLLTTSAVMNQSPLTMTSAWAVYDRLFEDDRATLASELPNAERLFRSYASKSHPSSKVWADAWLLAVAHEHNGKVVTFDRRMAAKSDICLLLS